MEPTELLDLVVRYANGQTPREIASATGISRQRLATELRKAGLKLPTQREAAAATQRKIGASRHTEVDWEAVAQRYTCGESIKSLSQSLNIGCERVKKEIGRRVTMQPLAVRHKIAHTKSIPGLHLLFADHTSGVSLAALARRASVKTATLLKHFHEAGFRVPDFNPSDPKIDLPTHEIAAAYSEGVSVNAIAQRYGVSRTAIGYRLKQAGVALRGISATANTPCPLRAMTRQRKQMSIRPDEHGIASAMADLGAAIEQQLAVGTYNLDIAFRGRQVAVEVEAGPAFRYPQAMMLWDRTSYLLGAGWSVLYVVTDYKPVDYAAVAAKCVRFGQSAEVGCYGVLRRDGKPSRLERHTLDGFPRAAEF